MSGVVRLEAGERPADDILAMLRDGQRVVIETEVAGATHEITLRHDGEVYYCDTPTTLHRHETADGMRQCLTEEGYGSA